LPWWCISFGWAAVSQQQFNQIRRQPSNRPNTRFSHNSKAALIYHKTGNLRAVQLLLGHTKVDSTVRYLGVELEDALSIAEKIDI
jgi:site-specific recombinase XerC